MNKMDIEQYERYNASRKFYDTIHHMPLSLRFDQVAIKQKKNICLSRLDVDISSEVIRGVKLNIPIIASNMSTVVNSDFCILLYRLGALGVMHRAGTSVLIEKEVSRIRDNCDIVACSVGIGDEQFKLANVLINAGANIIFVDIAHGYSDEVINFAKEIKNKFKIKVVIGNTTNINMLYEVADFADCLKIGIGQGSACETRNSAGSTEGQFTAVLKFKEEAHRLGIPIISDGSVKEGADFCKAIAAGANSIMCGRILAMCPESAAEEIEIDGKKKKIYSGMASRYVQNRWKGGLKEGTCPEGKICYLDVGEQVDKLLERYSGALRSGITYGGGKDIKSFQENVEFVRLV